MSHWDKIADSRFCLIRPLPFLPLKRQFFPKNKPTPINLTGVGFDILLTVFCTLMQRDFSLSKSV